jgi:AcrR family transcriptional regulator
VVLAATIELLAECGFERIGVDAIAERSGVARSTIYRNWPDRTLLLSEAFRKQHNEDEPLVSSGCLRDDLEALGHLLVAKLTSDDWARTVPSMISAAIHDDEIRSLARAFSRERREAATAIVNEGARRGEIGAPDQIDAALERFVAPFFFRRILSFQPLDEAFIESQVAATLEQLEAAERPRPERS